ncbi:WD40 repeat protein [Saccharothrix australiensis]|uniref:WD40 repeat protein n=2 Tax=Saccharothrix australiensis TaxID=2072 RepID=A0A495VXP1_9PSEU|nr:WD40 repeat protein [Saccharothrix australiensis]
MDLGARRIVLAVSAIVLVAAAGAVYVAGVAQDRPAAPAAAVDADLMFVELADGRGRVEQVALARPETRGGTDLACQRVYRAGGTTVCLRLAGPGPSYAAEVSRDGAVVRTVPLPGVPSRAKVSASGQVVSWTSFVTGDSYSVPGGFSTRTGYLDLRSGEALESLEGFTAEVEGNLHTAQDVNYWGLTVGADDRTFYATLASGGFTWLVKGDLVDRRVTSLRRDAECPSLSPDGTKIAYKKRIGRLGPWDLAVLDLKTGEERRLPGTAGVDDQATWLDDDRLAFAAVPKGAKLAAVHVVPADGSTPARLLVPDATSPSPL